MRKTKIICTIGPSCSSKETLTEMFKAGMNVARINFSHGTYEEHKEKMDLIKEIRKELKMPVSIMLDTKGPEYRIKCFKEHKVVLQNGQQFILTTDDVEGDETIVSVSYKNLANELKIGDVVLLNDGMIELEVREIDNSNVICDVIIGGELYDRKGMNFPGKVLNQTFLSEVDKSDILFGIQNDVDFIACSFVSNAQNLRDVKEFLKENNGEDIELIAKIENQSGIDNIEEICDECTGIMIGRGDMGVEIAFEELPTIQKNLITKCRLLGKRVITATEMLESMIKNPRPTRAETSDVANAVYDGTSAVMLSGETAVGKYPVLAVSVMSSIAEETEKSIDYAHNFTTNRFKISNIMDAISHATCGLAIDVEAKAIAVCSLSGKTAQMVSRFRSPVNIIGIATNEKACRKLALSWGVTPAVAELFDSTDVMFYSAKKIAQKTFNLKKGDKIILTGGIINGSSGNTNILKIETI